MSKRLLNKYILEWLKFKDNYLFISTDFERDVSSSHVFFNSSDFDSKKNFLYDYYLFNGKDFQYFKPSYHKRKKELFELFNQLEYVKVINMLKNLEKNFSCDDFRRVLLFIAEKSDSMKKFEFFRILKNSNFTQDDQYENSLYAMYKKYQKNIFEYFFRENNDRDIFDKEKNEFLNSCKELVNNLEFHIDNISNEIGIFFPVKKITNIFDTKEYLFEINNYKYKKRNFSNFTISSDKYHGTSYRNEVAYFDPIILLNKFGQEFLNLCESLKCEENIKLFMDKLNRIQFDTVILQQENLFNAIYSFRSENRQMSLKELVQFLVKQIDFNINKIDDRYKIHLENKKKTLLKILKNKVLIRKYKRISLDELGFKNSEEKKDAEQVYEQLQFILRRNLKVSYEEYTKDLVVLLDKNFANTEKNIQFIKNIVKYLITFGKDENIKVGGSYNNEFKSFYSNKKIHINNLYRAFDFLNENKQKKEISINLESFLYLIDFDQFIVCKNNKPFSVKL
ncbi:hypothetical protein EOL94_04475 [bacterium]|nr:hypothetical protein [bacterium]